MHMNLCVQLPSARLSDNYVSLAHYKNAQIESLDSLNKL